MKYFLDTEFIEDGKTIDLISIGIVAEDGRELYIENADADTSKANEWVKENVLPHLVHQKSQEGKIEWNMWVRDGGIGGLFHHKDIAREIRLFVGEDQKPEFWGYYADYDWVVFCQLFGTMMDLPKGFPRFCLDIKQLAFMLGNPKLPEQSSTEHHALEDARWNKKAFEFLLEYEKEHPIVLSKPVEIK